MCEYGSISILKSRDILNKKPRFSNLSSCRLYNSIKDSQLNPHPSGIPGKKRPFFHDSCILFHIMLPPYKVIS